MITDPAGASVTIHPEGVLSKSSGGTSAHLCDPGQMIVPPVSSLKSEIQNMA